MFLHNLSLIFSTLLEQESVIAFLNVFLALRTVSETKLFNKCIQQVEQKEENHTLMTTNLKINLKSSYRTLREVSRVDIPKTICKDGNKLAWTPNSLISIILRFNSIFYDSRDTRVHSHIVITHRFPPLLLIHERKRGLLHYIALSIFPCSYK